MMGRGERGPLRFFFLSVRDRGWTYGGGKRGRGGGVFRMAVELDANGKRGKSFVNNIYDGDRRFLSPPTQNACSAKRRGKEAAWLCTIIAN
jgi:hypothetical protein